MPAHVYREFCNDNDLKNLDVTNSELQLYDPECKVKSLGKIQLSDTNPNNGKQYCVEFHVVSFNCTPILGCRAVVKMQLITVNKDNIHQVTEQVSSVASKCLSREDIFRDFASVFEGQGTLQGELHL